MNTCLKTGQLQEEPGGSAAALVRRAGNFLLRHKALSIAALWMLFLLVYHFRALMSYRLSRGREKIRALYRDCVRLSAAAGVCKKRSESIMEFVRRSDSIVGLGLEPAAECYLESVFCCRIQAESF